MRLRVCARIMSRLTLMPIKFSELFCHESWKSPLSFIRMFYTEVAVMKCLVNISAEDILKKNFFFFFFKFFPENRLWHFLQIRRQFA